MYKKRVADHSLFYYQDLNAWSFISIPYKPWCCGA